MNIQGWQQVTVLGIVLAFLAIVVAVLAAFAASLNDANTTAVAHWLDAHGPNIWKTLLGVGSAVGTFLFGRSAGRKAGKTEAYNSAIATTRDKASTDAATKALRDEAKGHGLQVTV